MHFVNVLLSKVSASMIYNSLIRHLLHVSVSVCTLFNLCMGVCNSPRLTIFCVCLCLCVSECVSKCVWERERERERACGVCVRECMCVCTDVWGSILSIQQFKVWRCFFQNVDAVFECMSVCDLKGSCSNFKKTRLLVVKATTQTCSKGNTAPLLVSFASLN